MIMTHVDLIEKLLKYDPTHDWALVNATITEIYCRYTPDGRNEKKQRLSENE